MTLEADRGPSPVPSRDTRRRVTIVDVAGRAGVSTSAVSKVLRNAYGSSPAMRERVQRAIDELGYRPMVGARAMRGATYTIGVSALDLWNPFFGLLLEGIGAAADAADYQVLISLAGDGPTAQLRAVESMIDHRMDGLVLMAPRLETDELEALARRIPIVVLGRHGRGPLYDSVASDDALGARLAVDHLVGLGHQRVSFLTQRVSRVEGLPETFREAGYRASMTDHGLRPDVVDTTWTQAGGVAAARRLLRRRRRPTAVHGGADVAALGLLDELRRRRVPVPAELSVVGCDNTPVAAMVPVGLTSVDQDARGMGRRAARLLMDRIGSARPGRHFLHPPSLVVRSSSGPVPAGG
ncbi:LacI family transcriptional regulator [Friedmanniella endophytica]|uniref:LacI family transcriptional regulator n=1 Tax=Microlunatus kandeliicorticis TaxID=1759536 RepID=A0A7W3P713_9ACTN|nr:LacI family DNA-binding transcriptional regulator [Microlunatus kandeliicorticis]MBA8795538.1 LacI family transcriptional regulator [Microlunatus kandeliicorticis]